MTLPRVSLPGFGLAPLMVLLLLACGKASSSDAMPERVDEVVEQDASLVGGAAEPQVVETPAEAETPAREAGPLPDPAPQVPDPVVIPAEPPTFERPEHVRGLYLNAWTAGSSRRIAQLIEVARRTEINSFVIDIKDASGYVSHATGVELAREIGATGEIRIPDLPGLLRRLSDAGIYPIARIVIVKDPILAAARPELAVQDTAGGVWVDGKDIRWLNIYDRGVWDYHLDLAREMVELGFPEIQWDYVRFPDAPRSELARADFSASDVTTKPDAVRQFLEHSREELSELGVVVTADVFGVTTSAGDVGIGQVWERFIDVVDVALPMVYPSHYWTGSFGIAEPNAYPYEVVKHALENALVRSARVDGAGSVRPWIQAFTLGEPAYGAPEIRAQMQAGYDLGIEEWILWNPSSRYPEDALEPVGGFETEPLIRVAGRVVPVSQREEALRVATAEERDSTAAIPALEVRPDANGGSRRSRGPSGSDSRRREL